MIRVMTTNTPTGTQTFQLLYIGVIAVALHHCCFLSCFYFLKEMSQTSCTVHFSEKMATSWYIGNSTCIVVDVSLRIYCIFSIHSSLLASGRPLVKKTCNATRAYQGLAIVYICSPLNPNHE